MTEVVTRFAPSPTGFLHMGSARAALYNYIFSHQQKGKCILRIEDTDRERSKEEWTSQLIDDFKWLELSFNSTEKQSERVSIHKDAIQKLIDSGHAYVSKETPTEEGQRDEVIRFKNPNKEVTFTDLIRGEISVDTTDLKDFVIARSMEEPVYHLAVVVDDGLMGITHVIRGEDHISNTPRQILIQEALGYKRPVYAHLPLVLAEDKSKLSKRKHGETVSLTYYRERGYLPEAILNFLLLIGWNPGTEEEFFTLNEMIKLFDFSKVQKGGAVFNVEKLNWINKHYIEKLDEKDQLKHLDEYTPEKYDRDALKKAQKVIIEHIRYFGEIKELLEEGEFVYFFETPEYDAEGLVWKKSDKDTAKKHLEEISKMLSEVTNFSAESIKESVWQYAEDNGRGDVLWPLRFALSGREKSADPFTIAEILGKEETLKRVEAAIEKL